MNQGYEIVKYHPGYKREVAELQVELWSSDVALNIAYLEWKHEQNPYLESPMIYLALCEGKVVGMRTLLGVEWEAGNPPNRLVGLCAEDLVIHADHRNSGLHAVMMRAVLQDLETGGWPYVFSMSAGMITLLSSLAMGWRNAGPMPSYRRGSERIQRFPQLRRVVKDARFIWRYADKWPFREWGKERMSLHDLLGPDGGVPRGIDSRIVVEPKARVREMSNLVSMLDYDGRIRHVRDERYLSWRFGNPLNRYLFLYWKEEEIKGYLVLQQYITDYLPEDRINIVDWEATSPRIRDGLLQAAVRLCPSWKMYIWTASLAEETTNQLREAGFGPAPETQEGAGARNDMRFLLVKVLEGNDLPASVWPFSARNLLDVADWDLRMLYSMLG